MSGSKAGFSVTITAVDAATKQIDAINNRIRAMNAPAERLTKSFGKLADNTGITRLTNGMRGLARESFNAFENIGRMSGPLGAITSAVTVAGLAKLSSTFGDFGNRTTIAARRAGMSVEPFLNLGNAARLAGSSSEAMAAGMTSLKDNIFDFNAGRAAPMTIAAFNTLGVSLRDKVTGGLRSARDVLPELADALSKVKDPTQRAALEMYTLGSSGAALDPLLRQGGKALEDLTDKAAKLYGVTGKQIAQAAEFHQQTEALTIATEGFGIVLASDLLPAIGPIVTQMTDWIVANRDWISSDITGFIKDAIPEMKSFAKEVNTVVQDFGGWKKVIEGIVAIQLAGWALRMVRSLSPLTLALAGIALTIEKISTFEQRNSPENLPIDSPFWRDIPDKEQGNYVNSPRSQAFLNPNGGNPNPFSWWNPGSWFGHRPEQQPGGYAPIGTIPSDVEYEIRQRSQVLGLDPDHMVQLAKKEHGGYDNVSPKGAEGPMQVMPGTAIEMGGSPQDLRDWHKDIALGLAYYKKNLTALGGNYPAADAAYNAGPKGRGVAKFAATGDMSDLPAETRDYVKTINPLLDPKNVPGPPPLPKGPPVNIQGGTGSAGGSGGSSSTNHTVKGEGHLSIKLDGFPAGTKTVASTSGDLFAGPPRIEHAMPGSGP